VLDKNDFFLTENSICSKLGFIITGMCRYYYVTENGDEATRWVSLENEFTTSIASFIKQSKTHENIQAIKPTTILAVEKEEWTTFCEEEIFAQTFWTRAIQEYLIEIEARVYSLIAMNAQSRYNTLIHNYPKLVIRCARQISRIDSWHQATSLEQVARKYEIDNCLPFSCNAAITFAVIKFKYS
jgi:hypothetical protein